MVDPQPDEPARKKPLWRTFVPSLLILVGTFFFISSACFSDGGSNVGYVYEPCPPGADTVAPAGARAMIVAPADGDVLAQPTNASGEVYVTIKLHAEVIEIASSSTCGDGTGHFFLTLQRESDEVCVNPRPQTLDLIDGETQFVWQLAPGKYVLTTHVVTREDTSYVPEVGDAVTFTVEGQLEDGGVCP